MRQRFNIFVLAVHKFLNNFSCSRRRNSEEENFDEFLFERDFTMKAYFSFSFSGEVSSKLISFKAKRSFDFGRFKLKLMTSSGGSFSRNSLEVRRKDFPKKLRRLADL